MGHLRLVGDIALLNESAEHLQEMLKELQSESLVVGLQININKSEVMIRKHAENTLFSLGNATLEKVDEL